MTGAKTNPPAVHDALGLEARYGAANYSPLPVVMVHGRGAHLFDGEGRRYIDMLSAYSANNLGHLHPRVVNAVTDQLGRLALVSRAVYSEHLGDFCRELAALAGLDACLPMNTGAEAVETAIKACRRYGYDRLGIPADQAEIIVASGNFHGRTTGIVGFSSDPVARRGFGPFAPGFVTVPFGDAGAAEAALTPRTAAILVEPIQGEAGVIVPPAGYLADLRAICDRHHVLLVFDEVQSGFGRTGKMFAYQHEKAQPDGLIVGKALGGGLLPVSAFIARRAVMDVFGPGSHGSTFGGNPLAVAAARETLRVFDDEKLVERSRRLGELMFDALRSIRHPAVREIRGKGLWAGVEIDPAFAGAKAICLVMLEKGVLAKETHATVIRFAPPLVIDESDLFEAISVFSDALSSFRAP
jgi:ornithine--oxo-acid transaminase